MKRIEKQNPSLLDANGLQPIGEKNQLLKRALIPSCLGQSKRAHFAEQYNESNCL